MSFADISPKVSLRTSVAEVQEPFVVNESQITGIQPSVLIERLGRRVCYQ